MTERMYFLSGEVEALLSSPLHFGIMTPKVFSSFSVNQLTPGDETYQFRVIFERKLGRPLQKIIDPSFEASPPSFPPNSSTGSPYRHRPQELSVEKRIFFFSQRVDPESVSVLAKAIFPSIFSQIDTDRLLVQEFPPSIDP